VIMACLIWSEANDQSNLIRKLFANENLEAKENKWIWSIENKYYSCKVDVHVLNQLQSSGSCSKISNIGALIWCTTEAKKDDVELLKKWKKDFDLDHVDVQLIIVDNFDSEESKSAMNQWAIKEGVEIIDFSEDEEDSTDSENIQIFASNSQKRIVEALQTVMWTELIENIGEADSGATTEKDMEDFESLFANLVHFKETASGLPDDERRKFAEKVSLSFLSALGDDSD